MPIQPENRDRYPANWREISERIRWGRARGRCEWCGVRHGDRNPATGAVVVLTVHHLDHTPENCAPENLVALCQRCHLNADRKLHIQNARANLRKRREDAGQTAMRFDRVAISKEENNGTSEESGNEHRDV